MRERASARPRLVSKVAAASRASFADSSDLSLAGEPLRPVELGPRRPVGVAELAKRRLRGHEVLLHAPRPHPVAPATAPWRGVTCARRNGGTSPAGASPASRRADRLPRGRRRRSPPRGQWGRRSGPPRARRRGLRSSPRRSRARAASSACRLFPSARTTAASAAAYIASVLHVVALRPGTAAGEVLAGGVDVAAKRLEMSEPEVDVLCSGTLVAARLEELGPEPACLVEAARHREDVHEVAGRHGLEPAQSPAPGEGERGLGVLFGPGRSRVMQRSARLPSAIISVSGEPVAPGDGDGPLEERRASSARPAVAEKNGLRVEAVRRAARRARGAGRA